MVFAATLITAATMVLVVAMRVSARQPQRLFELRTSGGWVAYHQIYELYDSDELVMRRVRSGRDAEKRIALPPAEAGELHALVLEADFASFDLGSADGRLIRQASRSHDTPNWLLTIDGPGGPVVFAAPPRSVGGSAPELGAIPQVAAVWELSRRLRIHWDEVFDRP
jgi:hypothetical protein